MNQGNLTAIFGAAGFRAEEYVVSTETPESQFADAMASIGIDDADIVGDGQLHRVNGRNDKKKSCWYVLHLDGIAAGSYGDWRTGEIHAWRAELGRTLSWKEQAEYARRMAEIKAMRDAQRDAWQAEAADRADELISSADPCDGSHPYLQRKKVGAYGLYRQGDRLLIPRINGDGVTVRSYQEIWPDGRKKYQGGGQSKGCYHVIPGDTSTVYVGEGYATCATVFEATGSQVYVAFDSGNLPAIAAVARRLHPSSRLVALCDNDDAGRKACSEAKVDEIAEATGQPGADFNDMGVEATRAALKPAADEEEEIRVGNLEDDFAAIPDDLITLTGFMGQVQHYALKTAPMPNKPAACMAAIALAGAVLANKVQTTSGLRTSNQLILVAGSGDGKEHPRKINKVMLISAGLQDTHIGGDEIASGQGLMTAAARRPMSLFQLDEFGMWLKSAGAERSGSWEKAILSNLMKLHSQTGSIIPGQERADQRANPRVDIEYPCINLFGTTTATELVPALRSSQTSSGFLNRMIFLMTKPKLQLPNLKARMTAPPEEAVEWIKAARLYHHEMAGMSPDNPVTVEMDLEAEAMMLAYANEVLKVRAAGGVHDVMYVRAVEHVSKLALINAMSRMTVEQLRNLDPCLITKVDMDWATRFIRFSYGELVRLITGYVADSEFGGQCKEVLRIIKKGKFKGMTEAEISRFSVMFRQMNGNNRTAVFDVLRRDRMIELVPFPSASGRGRGRTAYVASEFIRREDGEEK